MFYLRFRLASAPKSMDTVNTFRGTINQCEKCDLMRESIIHHSPNCVWKCTSWKFNRLLPGARKQQKEYGRDNRTHKLMFGISFCFKLSLIVLPLFLLLCKIFFWIIPGIQLYLRRLVSCNFVLALFFRAHTGVRYFVAQYETAGLGIR